MSRFAQKFFLVLTTLLLLLPGGVSAASPTPAGYPANYRVIIEDWLKGGLVDPNSVVIKSMSEPRAGSLTVKGQKISGYLVDITVNARNIFGSYTGAQKHTALLRDGKVVTATGFVYR